MTNWKQDYNRRGEPICGICWLCSNGGPRYYFITSIGNKVSPACNYCKEIINVVEDKDGYVNHVIIGSTKVDFSSENTRIFVDGKETPIDWCNWEFELEWFRVKFTNLLSFFFPYSPKELGDEYSYKPGFELFSHYSDQITNYTHFILEELVKRLLKESWSSLSEEIIEEATTHCSKTGNMTEHFSKIEKYNHHKGTLVVIYKSQTEYIERCRRDTFYQSKNTSEWKVFSIYFEI